MTTGRAQCDSESACLHLNAGILLSNTFRQGPQASSNPETLASLRKGTSSKKDSSLSAESTPTPCSSHRSRQSESCSATLSPALIPSLTHPALTALTLTPCLIIICC